MILLTSITSCMNQVLSGVALWSYKAAMAPKDKEHPYGHSFLVPTSYSINLSLCICSIALLTLILFLLLLIWQKSVNLE